MAPRKKKAGETSPKRPPVKVKAGSPITIDGGGSISITFKEVDYPQGATDPDDHDGGNGTKMKTLKIADASGRELDLSPTVSSSPELNRIKVFYHDPNNLIPDGVIKIKSDPLGVRFSRSVFPRIQTGVFRNADLEITAVEVRYQGGWERISFNNPAVGKGTIRVDHI